MIRHQRLQRQLKRREKAQKKLTLQRTNSQQTPGLMDERPLESLSPDTIMQLSQQHGNHYLNGLAHGAEPKQPSAFIQRYMNGQSHGTIVQRMPTQSMVIAELGKPRKKFLGKEQSTKYKFALVALTDLNNYLLTTPLGTTSNDIKEQLKMLLRHYDSIISASAAYDGMKGAKARYFLKLKLQAQNEKGLWIGKMMQYANNPNQFGGRQPVLSNVSPTSPMPLVMDESKFKREVGGNVNKLQVYDGGNDEHYFKKNVDTIDNINVDIAMDQLVNSNLSPEEKQRQRAKLDVTSGQQFIAQGAGIDYMNARLASRDVATSRLDALLGADIIARTQFALRQVNGEMQVGSLQMGAKGKSGDDLRNDGGFNTQGGQTKINDPNLQRLLSKLQLMDALALQIDRHENNFYIHTDNQGNVIGVTGIDNDASFGTKTSSDKATREYPGLSRFVDRELARRIMTLDIELLELSMSDLLGPREMDALFTRLAKVQQHLAKIGTDKFLTPQQWDEATEAGMLDEKSKGEGGSYYQKLTKRPRDTAQN